jgi:hypothetical protein
VWLSDGKVLVLDVEDGGELASGSPSWRLGLGSEPQSMMCHVTPGRCLTRFPWWLKSAATSEQRCRVEQSTGGQCEMVKQTGSRSLALLRLRVVGDKGEGERTRGGERN